MISGWLWRNRPAPISFSCFVGIMFVGSEGGCRFRSQWVWLGFDFFFNPAVSFVYTLTRVGVWVFCGACIFFCLFSWLRWHFVDWWVIVIGDLLSVLMSETHDGSPDPSVDLAVAHFRRRRKAKAHKTLDGKLRFVVGHDIYLDRVEALCARALVCILEYASMDTED